MSETDPTSKASTGPKQTGPAAGDKPRRSLPVRLLRWTLVSIAALIGIVLLLFA